MQDKGDARWVANTVSGMSCVFGNETKTINRQGDALKHQVFVKCVILIAIPGLQSARGA